MENTVFSLRKSIVENESLHKTELEKFTQQMVNWRHNRLYLKIKQFYKLNFLQEQKLIERQMGIIKKSKSKVLMRELDEEAQLDGTDALLAKGF